MAEADQEKRRLLASERYIDLPARGGQAGRCVVVYPHSYAVGMSNLAVHTLWRLLQQESWRCDRAFLNPQPGRSLREGRPLSEYDLLAFTCSYELDYLNIPRLLEAGGLTPLRADRGREAPLLIAGGPAVTANPEPLSPLFDLLFIGEIEPVWPQLAQALREAARSREAALEAASEIPGIYCPDRPPAQPVVRQVLRQVDDYPTASAVVTPEAEFGDMFLVEVGRGCPHSCRFCLSRQIYHPFRPRSLAGLLETTRPAREVTQRIGLVGAAVCDHPDLLSLCQTLQAEGLQVSTSSLRADTITPELLEVLAASGTRSITLAPETGREELRRSIGKPLSQDQIRATVVAAQEAGLNSVKLYFLVGLPGETRQDRQAIAGLVEDLRRQAPGLRLEVSVNPLIPKAHTLWEGLEMPPLTEMRTRCRQVRRDLERQGLKVAVGSARWGLVQTAFSRGGAELAPVLIQASRAGGDFAAVREACRQAGLRLEDYLAPPTELPWRIVQIEGCLPEESPEEP